MKVTTSKLQKYCQESGGYDLAISGNFVTLSFAPTFPEATAKGDSNPSRVRMFGKITGNVIEFSSVEMEDDSGRRIRDENESAEVYSPWLDFIEENY